MLLLIDNYDSFVFNLARYFQRLGKTCHVVRNDHIGVDEVAALAPEAVILSPGPCGPQQAGCSLEIVRRLHRDLPIFGVCLGHQTIGEAIGGRVVRAPRPMHGRRSWIEHDGSVLFQNLPSPMAVGRYHSLAVDEATLPAELRITARSEDGAIMALEHREYPLFGVQFHPESILTEHGYTLLANFLRAAGLVMPTPEPAFSSELAPPTRPARPLPERPVTF